MRRAEGGAKIFGVFRVKNHDFTQINHIFSNFRVGGARRVPPPPGSAPATVAPILHPFTVLSTMIPLMFLQSILGSEDDTVFRVPV